MYGNVGLLRELEDRDDVAVIQLGCRARFTVEARPHLLGVLGEVGEHQLDRDLAIEHRVEAPVQHTHAALADALQNLVAADPFELLVKRPSLGSAGPVQREGDRNRTPRAARDTDSDSTESGSA